MAGVTPDDYNNQPGYRNFNAPPGTPGYFTVANPAGGPPLPGRTTESSTRNGNPQATQTAQAPPPTPDAVTAQSYTPEEIAGAKARGMIGQNGLPLFPPGSVKFNSQGVPYNPARVGQGGVTPPAHPFPSDGEVTPGSYTPVPWKKDEPPASSVPPLGDWKHADQVHPGQLPHIRPIPGSAVPNRRPDAWASGRPVWNPRPGETGFSVHPPPGEPYTFPFMLGLAYQAGFQGQAAYTAAAIGMAESKGNASAIHYNDGGKPFNSYGLMQINGSNDATLIRAGIAGGARAALDPLTGMKAAYVLSKGGTDFSPWSTYNQGTYRAYLDPNAQPPESRMRVAGPPQAYIPSQPREPQHWGEEPERDWSPGRMPQAHDIPGILGALLPIAIAGVLGGGGLGMIAAFAGYQNARNKGQLEAAKEEKTKWKDALEENTSRLKLELIGAKGIQAEFGGFSSPQAQRALHELALKFDDQQLATAIASGDVKSVDNLLNTRDKVFQDLSKTSEAQKKADQQEDDKRAEQQPYDGQPAAPGGGGGEGAPAAGPQPPFFREPGEAAAPAPVAAPPVAPGAAGVPPPGAGGGARPAPAATPPSAEEPSPSPDEAPPQAPAAAPPAGGGQPAAPGGAAPGAAPGPEQLPDVGVGGLAPPDLRGPLALPNIGLSPERLDQDARQYLESGHDPYKGGPSGDPLASRRNEAVRRRAAQMQSYIDRVIATTKPGDMDSAFQKLDTVDPGLASVARAVDRGDMAPPSGWQLRVPLYQNVQKLVTSLDPSWDATRWVTNYRTKSGFTTGTQSSQIAAANRALQHMQVLMDAAKQLTGGEFSSRFPDWNALVNAVKTHLGSAAATNFTAARAAVARELERAFRGGTGAYAEIKQDLDNVSASGSPEQILGYIRTSTELLKGQLDALADLYQRGTRKPTTGEDLLSPEARAVYHNIMKMPLDRQVPSGSPPPADLDQTATMPPSTASGPGPAPNDLPPGVTVTEEP